jgi:hypothetical protein
MITREALRVLENNLTFTKQIDRSYDDKYGVSGAKIGTVLNVRKPPKYVGRTGATMIIEDSVETSVPVALTTQFGVDISFTSLELGLSIDDFSKRFIAPAVAVIANKIDFDGLGLYQQVANSVGTAGTPPTALTTYLDAGVQLDDSMAPRDNNRSVVMSPRMQANLITDLKGLFQSSEKIADQYETGTMGIAAGFKFSMDQNVRTHTVGPLGGAPIVAGANQVGSTLLVSGFTAAAAARLAKGDTFTLPTVYKVNGGNGQTLTYLQTFTVTSAVSSAADGTASIPIFPPIVVTGAFKTVSNSPAASAPLTITSGTAASNSVVGLAFHRDAFTMACADLPLPQGVDMAARVSDKQLGLSIRMIRDYTINDDAFPCRLDVLYGHAALRPELACRILS